MNQILSNEENAIQQFNVRLGAILKAAEIEVTDQASLTESANRKISLESYIKAVQAHFANELGAAEERLKRLKNQVVALVGPAKIARDGLVDRQRQWMALEKQRADAEARRLQEEAHRKQQQKADEDRRAAERDAKSKKDSAVYQINQDLKEGVIGKREAAKRLKEAGAEEEAAIQTAAAVAEEEKTKPAPTVRVAPAIPTVAGVKNQTFYYAEAEHPEYLIIAYAQAVIAANVERQTFLRQFLTTDDQAIGKFARETKDNEKVMEALPGIRAWSRG